MELELFRSYFPAGTNGQILYGSAPLVHTIELPWKENLTGVSCIPEGRYRLYRAGFHYHGSGYRHAKQDSPETAERSCICDAAPERTSIFKHQNPFVMNIVERMQSAVAVSQATVKNED